MNVAQYIAKELKERGVKYVFGIPGGPSLPYIDEFRKQGIEFILTSHEAAAGIMADVTGRLSGIPGVCHATFGPGATNLSTGVGGAMLDRSPLIALTSVKPDNMRDRTIQMNIDHQLLFEPITKATTVLTKNNIADVLSDAFDLALAETPGPVHIGLPSDLAYEEVKSMKTRMPAEDSEIELSFDAELLELLRYSKKPLLAIGLTAARAGIKGEIYDFLEKCPVPLVLTPMAKGLVHEDHDYYCGVLFHAASDRLSTVIQEADLVIGLGYDPVEYNYEEWMPDVPLVHLNTVVTDMPGGMMVKQLTGSLEGVLAMISPVLGGSLQWDKDVIGRCRNDILSLKIKDSDNFGPINVLNVLQENFPDNGSLCLDVGSHIHLFGQYWKTVSVEKLLMTNGWSGMGFSIPAAIAAALHAPGAPVISLSGDGGFLMMCGEIITAKRLNLGIIFIVLSDRELNLIKLKEQKKALKTMAVDLYTDRLIGSKTFLGVPVISCDNEIAFRESLPALYTHDGPVIIELIIDPSDYNELVIT